MTKSIACRIRRFIKTIYVRSGFFQKTSFLETSQIKAETLQNNDYIKISPIMKITMFNIRSRSYYSHYLDKEEKLYPKHKRFLKIIIIIFKKYMYRRRKANFPYKKQPEVVIFRTNFIQFWCFHSVLKMGTVPSTNCYQLHS